MKIWIPKDESERLDCLRDIMWNLKHSGPNNHFWPLIVSSLFLIATCAVGSDVPYFDIALICGITMTVLSYTWLMYKIIKHNKDVFNATKCVCDFEDRLIKKYRNFRQK